MIQREFYPDQLAKLIEQYKRDPRLAGFILGFLEEMQEIEDATWQSFSARDIDQAEGVWLDFLGKLANQPRAGRSDDDYRIFIKGKTAANISNGTVNDMLSVLKAVESVGFVYTLDEDFPAEIILTLTGTNNQNSIFALVKQAKPVGVTLFGEYTPDPAGGFFFTSVNPVGPFSPGFASSEGTATGGQWTTALS